MDHTPLCGRFRVGSSLVAKMIRGRLSVKDTHGDFFSAKRRRAGNLAEQFVHQEMCHEIDWTHPFLVSAEFPFICATPDFVAFDNDEGLHLVEVKSGQTLRQVAQNVRCQRTLSQVHTALNVFNLRRAKIIGVLQKGDECSVVDQHVVEVGDRCELFSKRMALIKGYARYLLDFFRVVYELELSPSSLDRIIKTIDQTIRRRAARRRPITSRELTQALMVQNKSKQFGCLRYRTQHIPHGLVQLDSPVACD